MDLTLQDGPVASKSCQLVETRFERLNGRILPHTSAAPKVNSNWLSQQPNSSGCEPEASGLEADRWKLQSQ